MLRIQNRIQVKKKRLNKYISNGFLIMVQRQFNGERTVFMTNGAGIIANPYSKTIDPQPILWNIYNN